MNVIHPETCEASFDELLDFAKTRRARKLAHNTTLLVNLEEVYDIGIQYHNTEIVTYYENGSVRLNSGGWQTSTTKARFNAFLPRKISVWQNLGAWYVTTPNGDFEFEDGMVISDIAEWGEGGYTDAKVADVKGDAKEYRRQKRVEKKERDAREAKWRADRDARMVEGPPPVGEPPPNFCLNLRD
jgi:hypothetical protein